MKFPKTSLFTRRLSIFYLFVAIFSVFFGVFYYRFMPSNQAELNSRGFRILNQLAANVEAKDKNLRDAFDNIGFGDSLVLPQIDDHVHFTRIDTLKSRGWADSLADLGWCLVYRFTDPLRMKDSAKAFAVVRIADFMDPVVATRDDLFDNYALLMKDSATEHWRTQNRRFPDSIARMMVLYQQKKVSASPVFSMDSTLPLQKNTDMAVLTTVTIGGLAYTVFSQPFEFEGERVTLCGLIGKAKYDKAIKVLPTNFVVAMVLVILLGLMALPFAKVFLISPKEPVQKGDVLRIVLALYMGAAVLVLAGAYFLSYHSAQQVVETRLDTISCQLGQDIASDLRDAGRQLDSYISTYDALGARAPWVDRFEKNAARIRAIDTIFTPKIYPLVARLTWFDDTAATILKWNPFIFPSSYASEKQYAFFDILKRKNANDHRTVLDAGRSNVTGEFQILMARRLTQEIKRPDTAKHQGTPDRSDNAGPPAESFGIVLSFFLHAGLHPVLPRGYGFCLINNRTMQVMMHSDPRRNLAEDLYQETGENERLKYCIDQRLKASVRGVEYYGSSYTMYVRPVAGEEVTLIVFYNEDTHAENILRMLHFGAESQMYLSILFFGCLFLSTIGASRPSKLSFSIDPIEWIRPSLRNWKSYHFTRRYFGGLIIGTIAMFALIWCVGLDIRSALYISALLPFYALWGFVVSRKKEKARFPPEVPLYDHRQCIGNGHNDGQKKTWPMWTELFGSASLVAIVIGLLNVLIIRLMTIPAMDHGWQVALIVLGFQALIICGMRTWYYDTFRSTEEKNNKIGDKRNEPEEKQDKPEERKNEPCVSEKSKTYAQSYICSLFYSVLIISLIPSLGLLWYGWSVEKIQFLRSDELHIAELHSGHMKYVARQILPQMDTTVLQELEGKDSAYSRRLLYDSCRYLPTEHIQYFPNQRNWLDQTPRGLHDPDQPYINFLDELFLLTSGEYNSYAVAAKAADTSWRFKTLTSDSIQLFKTARYDSVLGIGASGEPRVRDFTVTTLLKDSLFTLWGGGILHMLLLLLVVLVFLWSLPRLLALSANRLFLLEFIKRSIPTGYDVLHRHFEGGWTIPDFIESPAIKICRPPQTDQETAAGSGDTNTAPIASTVGAVSDENRAPLTEQEEYILETMLGNKDVFKQIWNALPGEERYFIYDFADDGYTNYKDAELLFTLLRKGLLKHDPVKDQWYIFAISFREYVLRKKGSPEIEWLRRKYSVPGVWATIRIPTLIVIVACAILLILTQESISHQITVAITSVGAIVPILLEVTKRVTGK